MSGGGLIGELLVACTRFLAIIGFLALAACANDGDERPCGVVTCSATEFCDYSTNTCGVGPGDVGTCQPRRRSCPNVSDPVCGCDGEMHGNPCEANAADADLDGYGACPLQPEEFRCGFKQCITTDEVCQRDGAVLHGELNTDFACVPIPAACRASPSCECLLANQDGLCISRCDHPSGFVVTCDAGFDAR